MNQRIAELVLQATVTEEYSWGSSYEYFDKQQFADLIIQECVQVAKQADTERRLYAWYAIQKHYE